MIDSHCSYMSNNIKTQNIFQCFAECFIFKNIGKLNNELNSLIILYLNLNSIEKACKWKPLLY